MGLLIRDILEDSGKKYADITAVKWLRKKEIFEESYRELLEQAVSVRKGLLTEGFRSSGLRAILALSQETQWLYRWMRGCPPRISLI